MSLFLNGYGITGHRQLTSLRTDISVYGFSQEIRGKKLVSRDNHFLNNHESLKMYINTKEPFVFFVEDNLV